MNRPELHPVEALALALIALVWAVATIARALVVPALALLLTLARWRPTAPSPAPAAPWAPPALPALDTLPVVALRRLAREAGLPRCLAHRGRRDELLIALAVAW